MEQALNIAASLTAFGIKVNGFILNKMLPLELCCTHPFWQAKFESQQRWRQRLLQAAAGRRVTEIPELSGEKMSDGFLGDISELLGKNGDEPAG